MRLLNGLLALFLIAAPAIAAQQEVAQFCGLDDTDAGNTIPDCNSKSELNVETNLGGTVIGQRQGYSQIAALPITTAPISGSAYFVDGVGDQVVVVCAGTNCYSSKNNAAFTLFYSTASQSATVFSFVSANGFLYGADNAHDSIWQFDGTNFTTSTSTPNCSILALDQDRMLCANTVAAPNSINYSQSGNYTIWATNVLSPSPFIDYMGSSGDQITGINYWLGVLYIFKRYSIMACIPGDQFTTSCTLLNAFVGTNDPNSIVQAPDGLYFKGTDQNFWKYDGYYFTPQSLKIQKTISTFPTGTAGYNIQTGQTVWQAGTQSPVLSWNTTGNPGSIYPSTWTVVELGVLTTNWAMVDVDTTVASLQQYISNSTGTTIDPIWTVNSGAISIVNNAMVGASNQTNLSQDVFTDQINTSTGVWSFVFQSTATNTDTGTMRFWFSASGTNLAHSGTSSAGYRFFLSPGCAVDGGYCTGMDYTPGNGTAGLMFGSTTYLFFDGNPHTFMITRSTNGFMEAIADGNLIGTGGVVDNLGLRLSTGIYSGFGLFGIGSELSISSVKLPGFYQNQASFPYNTAFSTNVWGPYVVDLTSATTSSVTFQAEFSTAAIGPYSGFYSQTNETQENVPSSTMSWVRNSIVMGAPSSSFTVVSGSVVSPFIASVSSSQLQAATTGFFVSECINLPSAITSFGTLSCSVTLGGAGTETFYSTSAASCGVLPNAFSSLSKFTQSTNGATLTIATNTAVAIGFISTLGSSTDTAQVNSCILNYKSGAVAPPVWGIYLPVNNAIYWSGDVNNSSSTNRTFKFDLNNRGWFPLDLPMQAPLFYQNSLYFGNGYYAAWDIYGNSVYNDNGGAINAYWISKDWNLGEAFQEKMVAAMSIVSTNEGSGTLNVTGSLDGGASNSFSIAIGTIATTSYIRDNYMLPTSSPFTFFNVEFAADAVNNPWTILGYRMDYTLQPWRVLGPP